MTFISSGVYRITQISTGFYYIGSSIDISNRWKQHRYSWKNWYPGKRGSNPGMAQAWQTNGFADFLFEIIEECIPERTILLGREQHYIDTLKPQFNIAPGSRLGSKASDETKAKQSESMKGKNVGKIRTQETKDKLRDISLAMSDDTKEKMAVAKLGGKASDDTKARMRAAKLGKPKNPESTAKMVAVRSANRLRKLREAHADHTPGKRTRHKRMFSDQDIIDILSDTVQDLMLADKYACSPATIRKIRTRQIYKDVQP